MTTAPVKRAFDLQGVSLADRRLLQEIAATGSWQQAADNLGVTRRSVREKFARNAAFKHAYEELFTAEEIEATKRELEMVSGGLGKLYDDAINAEMTRPVQVECPDCHHKFRIIVTVMDWAAKLKAGDVLLKLTRLIKDEKSVKLEGTAAIVHMGMDEYLALQALRMGRSIPEHIYAKLVAASAAGGFVVPPNPVKVIEGEYREAENHS